MQIDISTRHGHLGAESQEKISAKLTKLSRYHERITAIVATVDLENSDSPSVEVRVSVERSPDFVAREQAAGLMAAVDGALHKLEQQLRRHKEKITDRRAPGLGRSAGASAESEQAEG
ncbi:MAG: ribosome-associated translation inhibitor RaiA [Pirellulaceae bacterium]|nr:ribosome-associated translation inhibitor RaiA [Planctomycetales bacterium]